MKKLVSLLTCDKSIWLYPNGFCLVDGAHSGRQQFFRYADGDILSVKALEFFQTDAADSSDVEVVIANEPPVVIPKELYHAEDAQKFVALQFDIAKLAATFASDREPYKLVYFLYQNEKNALDRLSFAKHFVSYWELICRHVQQEKHADQLLWVAEHEGFLDIYAEKKGNMMLLTRFNYVTAEDELYYIMNVKLQCHLKDAEVRIVSENRRSPLKNLAKKYLDNYLWID